MSTYTAAMNRAWHGDHMHCEACGGCSDDGSIPPTPFAEVTSRWGSYHVHVECIDHETDTIVDSFGHAIDGRIYS